jgi:hypothetical protein
MSWETVSNESRGLAYISNIFHYYNNNMGTNPYKEKMPNRGMGREMGKDVDDDKPQDVNVQEIGTDPQFPPPGPRGLGTNFTHVEKTSKNDKDDTE